MDLLALPLEIRILIYEYLFVAFFPLVDAAGMLSFPAPSDLFFKTLLPLLVGEAKGVHHGLEASAKAIFYARNRFVFDCRGVDEFLVKSGAENLSDKDFIRQLTFIVPLRWRLGDRSIERYAGNRPFKFGSSLRKLVQALPNLQSVSVDIQMRDDEIGPQESLRNLARPLLELRDAGLLQRVTLTQYLDRWNSDCRNFDHLDKSHRAADSWGNKRRPCKGNEVEQYFWEEDFAAREEGDLERGKEIIEKYAANNLIVPKDNGDLDKDWFRVLRKNVTQSLHEATFEDGRKKYYPMIKCSAEYDFAGMEAELANRAIAKNKGRDSMYYRTRTSDIVRDLISMEELSLLKSHEMMLKSWRRKKNFG